MPILLKRNSSTIRSCNLNQQLFPASQSHCVCVCVCVYVGGGGYYLDQPAAPIKGPQCVTLHLPFDSRGYDLWVRMSQCLLTRSLLVYYHNTHKYTNTHSFGFTASLLCYQRWVSLSACEVNVCWEGVKEVGRGVWGVCACACDSKTKDLECIGVCILQLTRCKDNICNFTLVPRASRGYLCLKQEHWQQTHINLLRYIEKLDRSGRCVGFHHQYTVLTLQKNIFI